MVRETGTPIGVKLLRTELVGCRSLRLQIYEAEATTTLDLDVDNISLSEYP